MWGYDVDVARVSGVEPAGTEREVIEADGGGEADEGDAAAYPLLQVPQVDGEPADGRIGDALHGRR